MADFLSPLNHLKLISSDDVTLYYPKKQLIRSCRFIREMVGELGQEKLEEIKLPFTHQQIHDFLTFLETESLPSIEKRASFIPVADHLDLDQMIKFNNKEQIVRWVVESTVPDLYFYKGWASGRWPRLKCSPYEWVIAHSWLERNL